MKVLDLFSGIGGFSLGLERAGMETVAFCEFEPHAQAVLKKHWPDVPIHEDVRTLDATQYRGTVDVVCGGFPCQDLSQAGNQAGFNGERSSLYLEMLRIISESGCRWAILENVAGLFTGESGKWFAKLLYDLAEIGFDAEWHRISAAYVGAPHHRDRGWIIAYPTLRDDGNGEQESIKRQKQEPREGSSRIKVSANANAQRCERLAKVAHHLKQQIELMRSSEAVRERFNLSEPPLCGANDGVPRRLDRLRRLGNAVVPQIPEAIGRAIMAVEAA
jgi:DNA (cytosine-5)-methyltransferase 1